MEFWLLQEKDKFQLPITPELFEVVKGKTNTIVNLCNVGEINIWGNSKLDSINISSFFPAQDYYFNNYKDVLAPYDCVALIEKFMNLGQVRLLITETNVNKIFYIENFNYSEKDGTRDVYYTIEFKEYKKIKLKSLPVGTAIQTKNPNPMPPPKPPVSKSSSKSKSKSKSSKNKSSSKPQKNSKSIPKTHKVKRGETASSIARKYYGSSSKASTLLKKNGLKSAKQIKIGMVLKI